MKSPTPKVPGRRFEILALLEHDPPSMESAGSRKAGAPGWTSLEIAATTDITGTTAHHLLVRLKTWKLVQAIRTKETVPVRREIGQGRVLVTSIPKRTVFWKITDKGKGRLVYFEGHDKWCPLCRKKTPTLDRPGPGKENQPSKGESR